MMDSVESLRAGIDWISLSMTGDSPEVQEWYNIWTTALISVSRSGNRLEASTINGYSGLKAGGSFVGVRDTGIYCQFSSVYADERFMEVYTPAARCTRIDLQVTAKFKQYNADVGRTGREGAGIVNATLPLSRRRKITAYDGDDGGYTLYIGAPSSEQRGRLYNKAVQSSDPQYERSWRYEVTFRADYAGAVADNILGAGDMGREYISDAVALWYHERGVSTPWQVQVYEGVLPNIRTAPTDVERRLKWLETQVAPAIKQLVAEGYADVVQSILFGTWDSRGLRVTRETE